jgi:transcriptional regulator with XRE-family HTH domain
MLREVMERRRLSYRDLGVLTGYNHGYLSRVARGQRRPSPAAALAIAKALRVKTADLFPAANAAVEEEGPTR